MGKRILLNKQINKDDVQYEWVAESTACDVCQSMNGVIYDSANDIPDRPHPNCKCHIEIIEKDSDETVSDPLEDYSKKKRYKKQNRHRKRYGRQRLQSLKAAFRQFYSRKNQKQLCNETIHFGQYN